MSKTFPTWFAEWQDKITGAASGKSGPAPCSVWFETKDRMPTAADAPNRMGHVIWMVCDGFVCEPSKEPWNWKCPKCCDAVAWMPIPPHPKWYPLNAEASNPASKATTPNT